MATLDGQTLNKSKTSKNYKMLKIGKNISSFSTYSCKPNNKKELINAIKSRMYIDGPECDLNDIDTSLITDMSWLFYESDFNGDISKWNVSNVVAMWSMFAYSKFDGDISKWNVSKVSDMSDMFLYSKFNQDISKWDVSNVTNMSRMFVFSSFNGDISKWNIRKDCETYSIFANAPIKEQFKPRLQS